MSPSDLTLLGGEFELRAEDLAVDPRGGAAFPGFGARHETWLDTGRSALVVAARDILRRGGRPRVWLPAYCCETVIAPFQDQQFEVRFYGVGSDLAGMEVHPENGDTLLFIHYFGHRNTGALGRLEALRAAGVAVVEDCVQAALTEGIGKDSDYGVSSLRKLLPQPDGALLASRRPVTPDAAPSSEAFVSAKVAGKLLRGAGAADETYLRLFEHAECHLLPVVPRQMSWLSGRLLRKTDLEAVANRRRANWVFLRAALRRSESVAGLSLVFDTLGEGEVPLGLPVRVPRGQRDSLRRYLAGHGIYCAIHWALTHLPSGEFAEERAVSDALLTLPIDQRYDSRHLERLVDALQSFPGDLR